MPQYLNQICTCNFAPDAMRIADALNLADAERQRR